MTEQAPPNAAPISEAGAAPEAPEPSAVHAAVAQELSGMQAGQMKLDLKPCPDGSVPQNLILEVNRSNPKIGIARGDTCPEWGVEFLIVNGNDQERIIRDAARAWNEAPRES